MTDWNPTLWGVGRYRDGFALTRTQSGSVEIMVVGEVADKSSLERVAGLLNDHEAILEEAWRLAIRDPKVASKVATQLVWKTLGIAMGD